MCSMRADNENGFTLIEVMVAVAVMGIVLLVAYRSIGTTSEAVQHVSKTADIHHTARVILGRLAEELVSADWTEDSRDAVFIGVDGNEDGRPTDSLRFRSRAHVRTVADARESDLNVVGYSLHNRTLLRQEEHNLLSLSDMTADRGEISGVSSLNFRYWDGTGWRDDWDAVRAKGLPVAVLIELSMADSSAGAGTFTTMVNLPLGRVRTSNPMP
jgi:type II secretion system protein J